MITLLGVAATLLMGPIQGNSLIKNTFKESADGWTGLGQKSKISIVHDAPVVAPSPGALKFSYGVGKGDFNALLLPAAVGSLKGAKSVKFRVWADATTPMAIAFSEDGGGRYSAIFQGVKNTWQTVELSVADFGLGRDANDPKDPDVKLDMDQVNAVTMIDLSEIFVQALPDELKDMFDIHPGEHLMYIEDFTVSTEAVPSWTSGSGDTVNIDTLVHPQLPWFGLGGVKVSRVTGKPLDGTALQIDSHDAPGKLGVAIRNLLPWSLTSTKSISFDAASKESTSLVIQIETIDGGKFKTGVDLSGDSQVKHIKLNFADFTPAPDSAGPDKTLKVDKAKALLLIESSGMVITAERDNTIWVNHLVASN